MGSLMIGMGIGLHCTTATIRRQTTSVGNQYLGFRVLGSDGVILSPKLAWGFGL